MKSDNVKLERFNHLLQGIQEGRNCSGWKETSGNGCGGQDCKISGFGHELLQKAIVQGMPRLMHLKIADHTHPRQSQIAHKIQDLMSDTFVGVTEAVPIQNTVVVEHNGIVKGTPLSQPHALKLLDVLEEAESSGPGDVLAEGAGIEVPGMLLAAHQTMREVDGVADTEMLRRDRLYIGIPFLHVKRPLDFEILAGNPLLPRSGFLDEVKIMSGAAVEYGNFRPVQLNQHIIYTTSQQCGHQMFNGGNRDAVESDAGSQHSIHYMVIVCDDARGTGHVHSAKSDPIVRRRRFQFHGNLCTGMQTYPLTPHFAFGSALSAKFIIHAPFPPRSGR